MPSEVTFANLALRDFRCYSILELELNPGLTLVAGSNGEGKTSLLEALGWLATGHSFRDVPDAAMVRTGGASAIVRTTIRRADTSRSIEAEIRPIGANRILVNAKRIAKLRDLLGAVRVTIFAPDDLELVKAGPAKRRAYLDDLLVALTPRFDAVRSDYDKVLRHRNALLRTGVTTQEERTTLEVFDQRLTQFGSEIVHGRIELIAQLEGPLTRAMGDLAEGELAYGSTYVAEWAENLPQPKGEIAEVFGNALTARRRQEIQRGTTLVGPHRDEWTLGLNGLSARTHGSQGEQRTLSLALRLGAHHLVAETTGEWPVLLLDDVFSELDPARAKALATHLPPGQTILTAAGDIPSQIQPERTVRTQNGKII